MQPGHRVVERGATDSCGRRERGQEIDRGGGADDGLVRQRARFEAIRSVVGRGLHLGHVEALEEILTDVHRAEVWAVELVR